MEKIRVISESTAIKIIEKIQSNLPHFKEKRNPCLCCLRWVVKTFYYNKYDVNFFIKKMKKYVLKEEKIENIKKETWILKNQKKSTKHSKDFYLAQKREQEDIETNFAGDVEYYKKMLYD